MRLQSIKEAIYQAYDKGDSEIDKSLMFYFDMDGVLADLKGSLSKILEKKIIKLPDDIAKAVYAEPADKTKSEEDQLLHYHVRMEEIISNLGKTPYADRLWAAAVKTLRELTGDPSAVPCIITAVPPPWFFDKSSGNTMGKFISREAMESGKRQWAKLNLNPSPKEVFVVSYGTKQDIFKLNENSILIDDDQKNITKWEDSGGSGIWHMPGNARSTINGIENFARNRNYKIDIDDSIEGTSIYPNKTNRRSVLKFFYDDKEVTFSLTNQTLDHQFKDETDGSLIDIPLPTYGLKKLTDEDKTNITNFKAYIKRQIAPSMAKNKEYITSKQRNELVDGILAGSNIKAFCQKQGDVFYEFLRQTTEENVDNKFVKLSNLIGSISIPDSSVPLARYFAEEIRAKLIGNNLDLFKIKNFIADNVGAQQIIDGKKVIITADMWKKVVEKKKKEGFTFKNIPIVRWVLSYDAAEQYEEWFEEKLKDGDKKWEFLRDQANTNRFRLSMRNYAAKKIALKQVDPMLRRVLPIFMSPARKQVGVNSASKGDKADPKKIFRPDKVHLIVDDVSAFGGTVKGIANYIAENYEAYDIRGVTLYKT